MQVRIHSMRTTCCEIVAGGSGRCGTNRRIRSISISSSCGSCHRRFPTTITTSTLSSPQAQIHTTLPPLLPSLSTNPVPKSTTPPPQRPPSTFISRGGSHARSGRARRPPPVSVVDMLSIISITVFGVVG